MNEATSELKKLKDGSGVFSQHEPSDEKNWEEEIEDIKSRQKELIPEIEFYNENKKDWNNVLYITAKELVSSVLEMDSKNVDEKIPEIVKSKEVVKQDLDNILEEAICAKNVRTKLKELLGENYIDPEEQAKMNSLKEIGVDIEKFVDKNKN